MGLQVYAKKRNFSNTPEPIGKKAKAGKQLEFVVQRHRASHLHYDFRLEMDGVMKSWAVPKGPSLNPGDKRLAMMVEDHPFDYRTFEGVIPEGNYGAGTVEIWDKGTYHALSSSTTVTEEKELLKELKKGNLKFSLQGKNLRGEFALVKIKSNAKKENAWLLIKHRDEYAVDKNYSSEDIPSLTKKKGKTFMNEKKTVLKSATAKKPVAAQAVKPERSFRYSKKNGSLNL